MNRNFLNVLLWIFVVGLLLASCKRNPYEVDVSHIHADLEIKRLEKDLFETLPENLEAKIPELKKKYGRFLQMFSYVVYAGEVDSPEFTTYLNQFLDDPTNREVYQATVDQYPDISGIEKQMEEGWKHYRYYFPEREIPEVYTFVSRFVNSLIIGDQQLGIGLDRYLGPETGYYKQLGLYDYQIRTMVPERIVPDCFYGWASTEWPSGGAAGEPEVQNVLYKMMYEAKLLYFVKSMLPGVEDSILFGFTTGQMEFCYNNEEQMWSHLIENGLLYATDKLTVNKLIGEGPFTHYFSRESPARAAVWLGYRIIESYMRNNPETKLRELMDGTDYQHIMDLSAYQPG